MSQSISIATVDETFGDSSGTNKNQPVDTSGNLLSSTLAASAFFTSKVYKRSWARPRVLFSSYADQAHDLTVEESWDNFTTVHNSYTASSAAKTLPTNGGSSRQVATIDARIIAPSYRVLVKNTSASPFTLGKLFGVVSSQ